MGVSSVCGGCRPLPLFCQLLIYYGRIISLWRLQTSSSILPIVNLLWAYHQSVEVADLFLYSANCYFTMGVSSVCGGCRPLPLFCQLLIYYGHIISLWRLQTSSSILPIVNLLWAYHQSVEVADLFLYSANC